MSPKKFISLLLLLSAGCYALLYIVFTRFIPVPDMPLYVIIPVLFAFTAASYLLIVQTKNKNPRSTVITFMLVSVGRLLIYGSFIFIYALAHREVAKPFAVTFFALYLIYTVLEIRSVLAILKK